MGVSKVCKLKNKEEVKFYYVLVKEKIWINEGSVRFLKLLVIFVRIG